MRLVGRPQTPESYAAGIIARRTAGWHEPEDESSTRGAYILALIESALDWHLTLIGRVLGRQFRVEGRDVHTSAGLDALLAGIIVALIVGAFQLGCAVSFEQGRSAGWYDHAKAQSELRR